MSLARNATRDTATALKCELASEVLRSFGQLRFPASGWSMLPTVWPGDTLVVERVMHDRVRIGDVVVVGRHGKLCAHRVIGTAGDSQNPQWITQGDALPVPDRPVAENELLGRVAYLIRRLSVAPFLWRAPSSICIAWFVFQRNRLQGNRFFRARTSNTSRTLQRGDCHRRRPRPGKHDRLGFP